MVENETNEPDKKVDVKSTLKKLKYERSTREYELAGKPKIHPAFPVGDAPVKTPDGYTLIRPRLQKRFSPPPPPTEEERREAKRAAAAAVLQKQLNKHTVPEITAMAAGLPSRVRSLYHRVDKLLKNGKSLIEALDEVQDVVSKYLAHRADVGVYGVLSMRKEIERLSGGEKDLEALRAAFDSGGPEATKEVEALLSSFERLAKSVKEADALMMLRAEYFMVGLTVHLCRTISSFEYPPHPSMAGLYNLIDLGNECSPSRNQRIADATKVLLSLGVELP
jgi:hypothetical protein